MFTLLLTARGDATSDLLASHFSTNVVRIDLDSLHLDTFRWTQEAVQVRGLDIRWERISAVYWRKPADPILHDLPPIEGFELRQRLHIFRSLSAVARQQGIWHLVDPLHEYRFPKPLQLLHARRYFATPKWEISTGLGAGIPEPIVTKALSPVPVMGDRGMVTAAVPNPEKLDPRFTWYLQSAIAAALDATVVYCLGKVWGYSLDRPEAGGWIDWRLKMSNHIDGAWKPQEIPPEIAQGINELMRGLGLHYGRLDFLVDKKGNWWFLEVNPNGQFGWLDPRNERGVLSAIASAAEASPGSLST
jgi:hypothetical protein